MPDPAVFISAKSEDYAHARKVFAFLAEQGIPCFFSDQSLLEMGEADYKEAIDSAIDVAPHLVVVTSTRANAESKWVKYEWNTFANELLAGRKEGNLLTIICGEQKPADLPLALRQKQVLHIDRELNRLPRFLPGARRHEPPSAGAIPVPGAAASAPFPDQWFERLMPAHWLGTLRHSRRGWILGVTICTTLSFLLLGLSGGMTGWLLKEPWGQGIALVLFFFVVMPVAFASVTAQQWLARMRLPNASYYWLFVAVLGEILFALLRYTDFSGTGGQLPAWMLPYSWWQQRWWIALAQVIQQGIIGTVQAIYLARHVRRAWLWPLACAACQLPLHPLYSALRGWLLIHGFNDHFAELADICSPLIKGPVLGWTLWHLSLRPVGQDKAAC